MSARTRYDILAAWRFVGTTLKSALRANRRWLWSHTLCRLRIHDGETEWTPWVFLHEQSHEDQRKIWIGLETGLRDDLYPDRPRVQVEATKEQWFICHCCGYRKHIQTESNGGVKFDPQAAIQAGKEETASMKAQVVDDIADLEIPEFLRRKK